MGVRLSAACAICIKTMHLFMLKAQLAIQERIGILKLAKVSTADSFTVSFQLP